MSISRRGQEVFLDFAAFTPSPKSNQITYKDFKDAFVLKEPPLDSAAGQGAGAGPKVYELSLYFDCEAPDAASLKLASQSNDQTIKTVEVTQTRIFKGARKDVRRCKYEGLTIKDVASTPISGEDLEMLQLTLEYRKATGKVTSYKIDGTINKSLPIAVDLDAGTLSSG